MLNGTLYTHVSTPSSQVHLECLVRIAPDGEYDCLHLVRNMIISLKFCLSVTCYGVIEQWRSYKTGSHVLCQSKSFPTLRCGQTSSTVAARLFVSNIKYKINFSLVIKQTSILLRCQISTIATTTVLHTATLCLQIWNAVYSCGIASIYAWLNKICNILQPNIIRTTYFNNIDPRRCKSPVSKPLLELPQEAYVAMSQDGQYRMWAPVFYVRTAMACAPILSLTVNKDIP